MLPSSCSSRSSASCRGWLISDLSYRSDCEQHNNQNVEELFPKCNSRHDVWSQRNNRKYYKQIIRSNFPLEPKYQHWLGGQKGSRCLNSVGRTLNLDKLACFGFSLRCSWMQQTTASFLWCRLSHFLTAFRFGCYTYFSIWDATQKHLETLFSSVSSLSLSFISRSLRCSLFVTLAVSLSLNCVSSVHRI